MTGPRRDWLDVEYELLLGEHRAELDLPPRPPPAVGDGDEPARAAGHRDTGVPGAESPRPAPPDRAGRWSRWVFGPGAVLLPAAYYGWMAGFWTVLVWPAAAAHPVVTVFGFAAAAAVIAGLLLVLRYRRGRR